MCDEVDEQNNKRGLKMKANTAGANGRNVEVNNLEVSQWAAKGFAAARILLGLMLMFGVTNALFNFVEQPPLPEGAMKFMGGIFSAPYFFALLKGSEFLVALALLSNRFVALALVVLAPITVNIVLFHLVLAPAGSLMALALLACHLGTAWSHRESFKTVLAAN
jgi:hypothetical protein